MTEAEKQIRRSRALLRAEGYLELGLPERALQALARIDDDYRDDAPALHLRGEALRALERYEEALEPLAKAASAAPGNIHVWLALAWCYKRTDRLPLAIDAMRQALEADPAEALLHYNLACYLSLTGSRDEALECLAQSLAIDAKYRDLIDDEPDFDPLRDDPEFRAIRAG